MQIRTVLIILTIAALLGSLLWLMLDPGWEPLIAAIGLIVALIAEIFTSKNGDKSVNMKQKSGSYSKNIQIGGDYNGK